MSDKILRTDIFNLTVELLYFFANTKSTVIMKFKK